jgi:DNA-binding LytR/AlgR family response regulator
MLARLATPLRPKEIAGFGAAVALAVALYCLAYNALAGRSESVAAGLAWAAVNVLPWFGAFEAGKRVSGLPARAAVLGAALAGSMALHLLAHGVPEQLGFELARRLPGLLAAAGLLFLVSTPKRRAAAAAELPLLPHQIDWVSAAGNYVELHAAGRVVLHRASLASVEALLAPRGFVRIHRSTLVRRDAVARVRTADLILRDGTSLPIGNRYRAAAAETRPFVPAE